MGVSSQHYRHRSKLGRSWSRFYHSDCSQWKAFLNTTDNIDPNLVGNDPDSTIQTPANGRLFSTLQTLIQTWKAMLQILPFRLQPMEGSSQHYRHWSKPGRPWSRFYHSDSSQWKALLNTTDIDPNLVGHDPDSTIQTPANGRLFSTLQTLIQTWKAMLQILPSDSSQWMALLIIASNLVGHDPDSTI